MTNVDHQCRRCHETFVSNNKLHEHIEINNHAIDGYLVSTKKGQTIRQSLNRSRKQVRAQLKILEGYTAHKSDRMTGLICQLFFGVFGCGITVGYAIAAVWYYNRNY